MIVLDTNVVAELMRQHPEPRVCAWIGAQPSAALYTTAVTQAEVLYGVALLATGKRRAALDHAARQMFAEDFAQRVLLFDALAAHELAAIAATRRQEGRPISQFDAQIAAIARSRGAAVATRNAADFTNCGIDVFNPWEF